MHFQIEQVINHSQSRPASSDLPLPPARRTLSDRVRDTLNSYQISDPPYSNILGENAAKNGRFLKGNSFKKKQYSPKLIKANYRAYDTPEPGPGLVTYKDRLADIICQNSKRSKIVNFGKTNMNLNVSKDKYKDNYGSCRCPENDNFYKYFPPQSKCPDEKPDNHKLSFIDDPPYSKPSAFLSKVHVPTIYMSALKGHHKIKKEERRKVKTSNSKHYCRYLLPDWIVNHPEKK